VLSWPTVRCVGSCGSLPRLGHGSGTGSGAVNPDYMMRARLAKGPSLGFLLQFYVGANGMPMLGIVTSAWSAGFKENVGGGLMTVHFV
jgi:hypothetical protein